MDQTGCQTAASFTFTSVCSSSPSLFCLSHDRSCGADVVDPSYSATVSGRLPPGRHAYACHAFRRQEWRAVAELGSPLTFSAAASLHSHIYLFGGSSPATEDEGFTQRAQRCVK